MCQYLFAVKGAFIYKGSNPVNNAYRYNREELVVVDISRAEVVDTLYAALEDYKNGVVISDKYQSCLKLARNVKVVVFANELPNFYRWSIDRYDVYELSDGELTYITPN